MSTKKHKQSNFSVHEGKRWGESGKIKGQKMVKIEV